MKKTTVIKLAVIASAIMLLAGCELAKDHVHTLRFVAQKDSTCTEKGNIAHYKCTECGATFSDEAGKEPIEVVSIPVEPSAHSLVKVDAKPATAEADGNIEHWKCTECGKLFKDKEGNEETTEEAVTVTYVAVTIPEGFIKLNEGTVTASIGDTGGPFKNASVSSPVTVNAFYMAQTETTYERWYAVRIWAESHGYKFAYKGREGDDGTDGEAPTSASKEPVTGVSWRDAHIWCNAASEMDGRTPVYYVEGTVGFTSENVLRVSQTQEEAATGSGKAEKAVINSNANGYRLPTEAEWEYAARGGDPNAPEWRYTYPGTNSLSDLRQYAVYYESKTAVVGSKEPNSAGLYDMGGNVWEYCQDRYSADPFKIIQRGGFYGYKPDYAAVACRNYTYPFYDGSGLGLRVVFSAL